MEFYMWKKSMEVEKIQWMYHMYSVMFRAEQGDVIKKKNYNNYYIFSIAIDFREIPAPKRIPCKTPL